MTRIDELVGLVARVTYKPGWTFKLIPPRTRGPQVEVSGYRYWDPISLVIGMPTTDVNTGKPIMLTFASMIEQEIARTIKDDDFIRIFVGDAIRSFELHEMEEWFKVDGKCVTTPQH